MFLDNSLYFRLRSLTHRWLKFSSHIDIIYSMIVISEIDLQICVLSHGVDEYAINKFLCQIFTNGINSRGKICSLEKESAAQKFDMKEEVKFVIPSLCLTF